jgi:hypothetical protein
VQANFDAIAAVMANVDVVFVEAAGNGSMDLDHADFNGLFSRDVRDSGAIIVTQRDNYDRDEWEQGRYKTCSNLGSRIDLSAWGNQVVTAGENANDDALHPYSGDNADELNAGIVEVKYGRSGVSFEQGDGAYTDVLTQGPGGGYGLGGAMEFGDLLGGALAAGDLDGDGYDDLAVGAPGETFAGYQAAGVVHVARGSATGLYGTARVILHGQSSNIGHHSLFGRALQIGPGDTDDSQLELIVGRPGASYWVTDGNNPPVTKTWLPSVDHRQNPGRRGGGAIGTAQ